MKEAKEEWIATITINKEMTTGSIKRVLQRPIDHHEDLSDQGRCYSRRGLNSPD
ncbi:hypothetical protein DPMN_129716 [Dreissena polymorpha]|uniref:Uncharacterized protein n=1 Tax=Dreissena polymorpha TaxID=45954 RepID=A0A9D4H6C2_DREPO|nr:hypothetical protein DPMN_129716 [Dreissena polymorpha]